VREKGEILNWIEFGCAKISEFVCFFLHEVYYETINVENIEQITTVRLVYVLMQCNNSMFAILSLNYQMQYNTTQ